MDSRPASRIKPAFSNSVSSTIPPASTQPSLTRIPMILPPRFNIPLKDWPPDGRQDKFSGVRAIRPPGPTVSIRPASLLYRAPNALHGAASHLLRHILHTSSPAASPRTNPASGSPVNILSLRTRRARESHGPLVQSDAILCGFLLNNGGYLDDSDSETEAEDPSDCHTLDPSIFDISKHPEHSPNQTTKPIPDKPKSGHFSKGSIKYF